MTRKCILSVLSATAIFGLIASSSALAHEFIVKPAQLKFRAGYPLPFSVISSHVFMISEEMEPLEQVEVCLIDGNGRKDISLKPNDVFLTLDGKVDINGEGTSVLCGHRKGMIWTKTTKGWVQASKKGLDGIISSGLYEKFCKTLITTGKADDGFKQIVGHRLEIVPVDDPGKAQLGKDLVFKVLFEDKPLATEVYASYDGFSSNPNTYAYFTETDEKGIANVRISHPGTWMVRAQHKVDSATEDYDTHVMRAILVFGVR